LIPHRCDGIPRHVVLPPEEILAPRSN
jgi:hypothetical protein